MIAEIAVSAAVYAIDRPYSYNIPGDMNVQAGMRVIVPFGRGNRRTEGIVLQIHDAQDESLKSIDSILDLTPIISEKFIRMAAFIRERYFCTFYDAIKTMLPAGMWFDSEEVYSRTDKLAENAKLSDDERVVLSFFQDCDRVSYSELALHYDNKLDLSDILQKLVSKKLLKSNLEYSKRVKDKTELFVSLGCPAEQVMEYAEKKRNSAPVQYAFLKLLCTVGSGSSKELCYLTGATNQTIRRLVSLGYVTTQPCEVFRTSLPTCVEPAKPIVLTAEQENVYKQLLAQSEQAEPGVSLLYGVTGSGKTSVYLHLIEQMLQMGKSAIVMVPEIALTPQLVCKFMSHFGQTVSVLHSALRVSERYDAWKKIKCGKSRVIIGTRSAVFAPTENLGLIIVDEEQEHSYKSENTPRYHAREVAIYRGYKEQALVLLGSATPSIESMYHAKSGTYTLHTLSNRYNGKHLPDVEIVDMKKELQQGNGSGISHALYTAIGDNLQQGRQNILFLNRRGAGQHVICVDCGDVPQCPRCSVSLTFHKANRRLMCHHCGYSQPIDFSCDQCNGHRKVVGTGTQRVEVELQQLFPDIQTIRMDADTISAANTHETIINRFQKERIPVMIGTQMVTKGLNFENVTLVGVVDADMSLYVNHYRAAETTFSMLTQVIGRSGRGEHSGKAIIQTMTPEHTVIQLAARQDYDSFYELEIALRKLQKCPPFSDIFTLTFSSLNEDAALFAAHDFYAMLGHYSAEYGMQLLGPSPAPILKVNMKYRYKMDVCCENNRKVRLMIASLLKSFHKDKKHSGVAAYIDVNSYE